MTAKNQMYFAANPDAKHDEHVVDYHVDNIDLKLIPMLVSFQRCG